VLGSVISVASAEAAIPFKLTSRSRGPEHTAEEATSSLVDRPWHRQSQLLALIGEAGRRQTFPLLNMDRHCRGDAGSSQLDPMRRLHLPSSSIVCLIRYSVEPDQGAVRRYTRAAVPLAAMTTPPKYLWTREWVTRLRWRNRDREGQQRSGSSPAGKLSQDIGSVAHRPVRHRSTRHNHILAAPEGAALSQRYPTDAWLNSDGPFRDMLGPRVCGLAAGGRRIRTCGPTPNGTAVGTPPRHRRFGLTLNARIPGARQSPRKSGTEISNRFPPAQSL
jgi:hypothetical protein